MAEAKQPGGLYYVGDQAVDANGQPVEGAPKKPKDTPRDQQPGAAGGAPAGGVVTMRLDDDSLAALGGKPKAKAAALSEADDEDALPPVRDLADAISKLDAAEVKAMAKKDDRATAQPIYKARLVELEGEK